MKASKRNYKDIKVFKTHILSQQTTWTMRPNDNLSLQPPDPMHPNSTHKMTTMDKGNGYRTPIINTQGEGIRNTQTMILLLDLPHVIPDESEPKTLSAQDELMRWHLCLNHMPFKQICKMAKLGLLPKKILMAQEPVCPACQYGKMHCKLCRIKGGITNQAKVPMRLGQIVSVDQLESTTPGFIAQLKGKLTKQ